MFKKVYAQQFVFFAKALGITEPFLEDAILKAEAAPKLVNYKVL